MAPRSYWDERDAPETARQLADGSFQKARAAALAAGIIGRPTALDRLHRAWKRATREERRAFRREIGGD